VASKRSVAGDLQGRKSRRARKPESEKWVSFRPPRLSGGDSN